MALGRPRTSKRSSSSSYASTVTTVVFIALCVLGVWMLTSNSVVPPQTTTRTASDTSAAATTATTTTTTTDFSSSSEETQLPKSEDKEATPAFEDNPGDLPLDAIKSDESSTSNDDAKPRDDPLKDKANNGQVSKDQDGGSGGGGGNEAQLSEESTMTQKQVEETQKPVEKIEEKLVSGGNQEQNSNSSDQSNESTTNVESDINKSNEVPLETNAQEQSQQQLPEVELQNNVSTQEIQHAITNEQQQQATNIAENSGDSQSVQQKPEIEGEKVTQESEIHNQVDNKVQQKIPQQQEYDSSNTSNNSEETTSSEQNQQHNNKPTEDQQKSSNSHETPKDLKTETKVEETTTAGSLETSGIPKESKESKKSWSTQAAQSENEKDRRQEESTSNGSIYGFTWQLCNVTAGPDYIPCLDNEKALKQLRTTKHFEHRERHCPEEGPTCLVPQPEGYKRSIEWPASRDKIWYHNVPHTKLAEVKGHQNWVKVTGEFLTFPGGGTQFIHGALHYIDFLQQSEPDIAWGKKTRVILDVGCGVASFGGFLFEKDVLAMSFAPKDEHEAQVQFALERGIPAISAVMGSQQMSTLTKSMCWELVTIQKDKLNSIGAAIYRKPSSNECYDQRKHKSPPMCKNDDDPNAAWYVPLQACMHRVPIDNEVRGSNWPKQWPQRLQTPPYWLNSSQMGVYGKPAPQDFSTDYEHWKRVVNKTYMNGLGINMSNIRNVMDMRSVYGGFAAALRDLKVWVMNVVNVDSPDTLPIIYERGLFGIYHDWCQSFNTYPRTYDLLHADHLFSKLKKRCKLPPVMAEVDRVVRPGGKLIIRDESSTIGEVENLLKSLHWVVHLTFSKNQEGLLSAQKGDWRPDTYAEFSSTLAIGCLRAARTSL